MGVQIVTKKRKKREGRNFGKTHTRKKLNMKLHIIAFALVVVSLSADAKDLGQYSWNNGRNFRKISDDQDIVNDTDDKDAKDTKLIVPEAEEELGYVDSIFGRGTRTRVTDGVFKWAENRVRSSPEC